MSNKSIIYFSLSAKASAFCISQIVFGFLCIVSNLLLFFVILSEKKLRQSQRFIAGSALGSVFLGAGFISFYLRIVLITDLKATLEPKQCLTQSPHITFYVLGDTILAISVFSSSVERLIAVSKTRVYNKLRSKAVSMLQVMIAILSLIDLILCWYCTFYKQQIHVSVICIEREVLPKELYTMHFFCISLLGSVTVILFLLAAILLKRNRSTCRDIRQLQLKRETIIMKRILVAVVFTLLFQNIPAMLNLKTVLLTPNVLSLMPDYFWLMQNISCTIYAAVCILLNNSVKRHLKSICLFSNFSAIMPTQMCTYR
ncbi:Cannabinoid receptor [Trichinella spiralis]|uniref:Cannabinoid receptor n=1 Tax=Trichinella spiralis TaxID=6334 RepID=A0ABR3KQ28_TRISP